MPTQNGKSRTLKNPGSLYFQITKGLRTELNRLYTMFCERHPYFEPNGGKVSIVAHSLGRKD